MSKLNNGDQAIPFHTVDLNGDPIQLSNYRGQKLYLTFFRKAACPFCNMGLRALIQKYDEFTERGINIIALFASPKEEILQYAGQQNAPFPIVPDGQYEIYKPYGIDISYAGTLKTMLNPQKAYKAMTGGFFNLKSVTQDPVLPADFLIDEAQNVVRAHYGKTYDDHLKISTVLEWKVDTVSIS